MLANKKVCSSLAMVERLIIVKRGLPGRSLLSSLLSLDTDDSGTWTMFTWHSRVKKPSRYICEVLELRAEPRTRWPDQITWRRARVRRAFCLQGAFAPETTDSRSFRCCLKQLPVTVYSSSLSPIHHTRPNSCRPAP